MKDEKPLNCKCGSNDWEYIHKEIKKHTTEYTLVCLFCGQPYMIKFMHTQHDEVIGK